MFEGFLVGIAGERLFQRRDVVRTVKAHAVLQSFVMMLPLMGVDWIISLPIQLHMYFRLCRLARIELDKNFWKVCGIALLVTYFGGIVIDLLVSIVIGALASIPVVGWVMSVLSIVPSLLSMYAWYYLAGKAFVYSLRKFLDAEDIENIDAEQLPDEHWLLVLVALLFNPLAAGVALWYSMKIPGLYYEGQFEQSKLASRYSQRWSIAGIVSGVLFWIVGVVLLIVFGGSLVSLPFLVDYVHLL